MIVHGVFLLKRVTENFYAADNIMFWGVMSLNAKLSVDGEEIDLNEFVEKILSGTVAGAVASLRGIKKDWKTIEIRVIK